MINELMRESKNVFCDTQITLKQLQTKISDISELEQMYSNGEDSSQVAQWCQQFHKQRLLNIELKDKHSLLAEQFNDVITDNRKKDKIIRDLNAVVEVGNTDNRDRSVDFASIAVQTRNDLTSQISEYSSDTSVDELTSKLENERVQNKELRRAVREKELVIISRDEMINKIKSEVKYLGSENLTGENTNSNQAVSSSEFSPTYVTKLKSKMEEDQKTIFRYQILLEKAHKENQNENYEHKIQLNSIIKERDNSLRSVKELQLIIDSIPSKDNDMGQQQSMFLDQIQSMTETIRVLEKQLSSCRLEKSKIESDKLEIERIFEVEKTRYSAEKDKQEAACKGRSNLLQKENERLLQVSNMYKKELEQMESMNSKLQREMEARPSELLTALIRKMRDELVSKDKTIADLRRHTAA